MGKPETVRPVSSDPVELAWAAGFFDGEGSVFVTRHKDVPHRGRVNLSRCNVVSVTISVSQVELQPLLRFAKVVGGRKPTGPYKPRKANARPYYRWDACGRPSVVRILRLLWPYLSEPKRRQARTAWAELESLKGPRSPILPALPQEVLNG